MNANIKTFISILAGVAIQWIAFALHEICRFLGKRKFNLILHLKKINYVNFIKFRIKEIMFAM